MLLECDICGATVNAEQVADYQRKSGESDDPEFAWLVFSERFVLLKCPRCERPFVVKQIDETPDDPNDYRCSEPGETLLPAPYKRVDPNLPKSIRSAFEESLTCLRSGALTACTMMCRKTLEAVCIEANLGVSGLAAMLKKMRETDIIDGRLYEWADALRLAGNEAAHAVDSEVSRRNAVDTVDFTHALVEYTYTYRQRFKDFMERRNKERADGASDSASDS